MAMTRAGDQDPSKFGAKANFIRSQSDTMSAKDIVETAAKLGMKVSVNHVCNLRAAEESAVRGSSEVADPPRRRRVGRPPSAATGEDVEQRLRTAIAELGLRRAREVFDMIEAAFGNPRRV